MTTRGTQLAQTFMMHRGALIDLLDALPADKASFSAWEGGMSFQGLADHLAGGSNRLLAMAAGQAPVPPIPSSDWDSAFANLKSNTQQTAETLSSLTDAQLDQVVSAFGRQLPVDTVVNFLIAHETHHKGQIWMMSRMAGLTPPFFVKLG